MTTMSAATAIALSDLRQQSGLPFRKAFSNSHLADVISRHVNDFRDRAYPPDLTLMAFCSQIISPNSSCRKAVVRINRDRSKNGLSRVSASTSAYCQARSRLPVGLIRDLALETADFLEDATPTSWHWLGVESRFLTVQPCQCQIPKKISWFGHKIVSRRRAWVFRLCG